MNLVPYWKKAHKLFSVQAMFVQAAFLIGWSNVPADLKSSIPTWFLCTLALVIFGIGVYGALVAQPSVTDATKVTDSD